MCTFQGDHDVVMQLCKDGQKFPADSLMVGLCKNGDLSFSVRSWTIKVTEQNTLEKLEYIDYNACVYYTVNVFWINIDRCDIIS